ncbi:YfmJ protein [Thecamonas trahens ATCC 50062]|uniref:YfmJ protein n=1 Tax=Thecamonas trahens ATCC 50062 TaxID=461836 RepID=A0A0L0DJX6_THETB|nr:YfmJ protein [Thecamonas trahens ATCC 50062]KNC52704.1 YfmJ protein [Thecamonas trahens ATCC 50062]|eukprot:XP_013755024.1 YfmJ protein [Thecamonas trahens ATCC 50062]
MSAEATGPNKAVHVISRPEGMVSVDNFAVVEVDEPTAPTAEAPVQLKLEHVSVDPYMRGRMRDAKSYIPPFALGEPGAGGVVARVVAVADDGETAGLAAGDLVVGMLPWVLRQNARPDGLTKVDEAVLGGASSSLLLGVLGLTGLTALLPIEKFSQPEAGKVAFVSGAAGAVGSVAGAVLKAKGCTVYGSAGSDEKCAIAQADCGFDAVFNYKTVGSPGEGLDSVLDGKAIDIYYDNVGGEMLDAVLARMAPNGVIICCGAISQYNKKPEELYGLKNYFNIIGRSLSVHGFIVTNWANEFPAAIGRLAGMLQAGQIPVKETVREGFESVPAAFVDLFKGANVGKMIVSKL